MKVLAKLGPAASALAPPVFALAERLNAVGKVAVDTLVQLAPGAQLRRLCLQHLERLDCALRGARPCAERATDAGEAEPGSH